MNQRTATKTIPVDTATSDDTELATVDIDNSKTAHRRFNDLLATKPRAKARHDAVLAEITAKQATLRRIREARSFTQATIAQALDMDQSEVSRLERRSDMLLSTLRRFIEATGGEMHVVVTYPDGGPVELLVDEHA